MGQKDGKKLTDAADLQPTISKFDNLLGGRERAHQPEKLLRRYFFLITDGGFPCLNPTRPVL
jgi:hypothetical protein